MFRTVEPAETEAFSIASRFRRVATVPVSDTVVYNDATMHP